MYYIVVPPVTDGVSTSDVPVDIDGNPVTLILYCPIKKTSPPPDIVWLYNGMHIIVEDHTTDLSFYTGQVHSSTNLFYNYTLIIASNNDTYQFVYDNIIGMYQCIASNEAGHVIVNRRVLFKCKSYVIIWNIEYVFIC